MINLLAGEDRLLAMRAADVLEKVTRLPPNFLAPHKGRLIDLTAKVQHKELQWHLAQLLPRIDLNREESCHCFRQMISWLNDPNSSAIVRVNALQAAGDIAESWPELAEAFQQLHDAAKSDPVKSVAARVRKIKVARK